MKRSEDYTQALEKALSFMKGYERREISVEEFSEIFPEFKMSEDECMRRALIKFTRENQYMYTEFNGHKITKEEFIMWLEKKPVGKAAPNFKVGEWYVDKQDGTILLITKVLGTTYKYITNTGGEYCCSHYSLEQDTRPWTIQDAKDGDILATPIDVLIFKNHLPKNGGVSYCHYTSYYRRNQFNYNENNNWYFGKEADIHPATKEQRDALMKAMTDAGYTFDFEKKELKKIEQKPAEWEPQIGDFFRKKGTTSPTYHLCDKREDGITFGFVENREVGISGGEITIFSLKQDYELVERPQPIEKIVEKELNKALQTKVVQKHSWSEEEEKILDDTIEVLEKANHPNIMHSNGKPLDFTTNINFLKSLKDKVQPKVVWSEKDDEMLDSIIEEVRYIGDFPDYPTKEENELYDECLAKVDWLKSLKDRVQSQKQWKPTEEQLENLLNACNRAYLTSGQLQSLRALREQLKQL